MGYDSSSSSGWETRAIQNHKVFRFGSTLMFGVAGAPRVAQVLRYHLTETLDLVNFPSGIGQEAIIATDVIEPLRACLQKYKVLESQNGVEMMPDTELLIGCGRRMFHVGRSFQVTQFMEPFTAIGLGAAYALGALEALHLREGFDPKFIVAQALRISGRFCNGVKEPYKVEVME